MGIILNSCFLVAKHEASKLFQLITQANDTEFILRSLPEELKTHFVSFF